MIDWLDELPAWTGFLRSHGFQLSVGDDLLLSALAERLRTSRVQLQDAEAAARWLGPAFCRHADDQAQLPILLREWAQALEPGKPVDRSEPEIASPWWRIPVWWRRIAVLAGLALAAVIFVMAFHLWFHQGSPSEISLHPVTNAAAKVSVVRQRSSWISEIFRPILVAALFGLAAFAAAIELGSSLRRRAALFRGLAPRDARAEALTIAAPASKLFRVAAMRPTFSELRRHRKVEAAWIDPKATVAATIAASGFITIIRGKRLELPEHLLLVDLANSEDIFGAVADLISNRLREGDVPFERFDFRGDPRRLRCTGPRAGGSVTLDALHAERPNARIFVLSDAGGFGWPGSEQLQSWVDELQAWNDVALLTPLPPRQWGLRERTLIKRGFLVVQATPDGVATLARLLHTDTSVEPATPGGARASQLDMRIAANPFAWLGENQPEPQQTATLLDDIQGVIDQRAMLYFSALAVFPALHPNLTLLVGSLLAAEDGQPVLDETTLAQLCRLPWLRQGRIPDWLRLALVRRLQERPAEEARVLAVWAYLLEPRPEALGAASMTAVNTMHLLNPEIPKLVAELIRRRPAPYKEAILLSFLNRRRLPELAIELPERLVETLRAPPLSIRKLITILETWTAKKERLRTELKMNTAERIAEIKNYAGMLKLIRKRQAANRFLADDSMALYKMGYVEELSRRMSGFSNFSVAFSIICILAGGITSFQSGYSTGGGFTAIIGWIAGGSFALIVGASMAQIASAYPTAGALDYWSSILGGRGWGWATAWFNMLGLIFVIASVNVGAYFLFIGLILGNIFGVNTSSWGFEQQTIAVVLITVSQGLFNHFGIRTVTKLIDFSGYLILVVAIVLTISMLYSASHIDLSRLVTIHNFSGAPGGSVVPASNDMFYLFLLAMLYPLYTITGFDGSAHVSEESKDARHNVPRGILNSIFWSMFLGLLMAASFVLAMPDPVKAAADGGNVVLNLMAAMPVSNVLKYTLYISIVIANYLCALASVTAMSRTVFAFSRDGGLPGHRFWRRVSQSHRAPVPAIWLTVVLSILATLYSPAFTALAAGCAMFLYISYAMPVAAGLFAEGKTWTEFGPFRLGIWSKPLAVITSFGALAIIYIGTRPPNDIVENYLIGLIVLLVVIWFARARKRFSGPPIGAAAIARTKGSGESEVIHEA